MLVCVHMVWGVAADNMEMLKGAEGQAACTALAKALASCTTLRALGLYGGSSEISVCTCPPVSVHIHSFYMVLCAVRVIFVCECYWLM